MPLFKSIRTVTITVFNLEQSVSDYVNYLSYVEVSAGTVSPELAQFWNAPDMAMQPFSLLQPQSGDAVFIRLIKAAANIPYEALKTYGWNAAELHVADVYRLAESLADSPFRVIGGPRDLLDNGTVVAMQVLGPSGECLYLTQISHPTMQRTYGKANCVVDRTFIAVLGASDLEASIAFYRQFACGVTTPKKFNIRVLANAHGLHETETLFHIASATFTEAFRIEMDHYPPSARRQEQNASSLPCGVCLVSICLSDEELSDQLSALNWIKAPNEQPYCGCQLALLIGPDGEKLELMRF